MTEATVVQCRVYEMLVGDLLADNEAPTDEQLASRLGISASRVAYAIKMLAEHGMIETEHLPPCGRKITIHGHGTLIREGPAGVVGTKTALYRCPPVTTTPEQAFGGRRFDDDQRVRRVT